MTYDASWGLTGFILMIVLSMPGCGQTGPLYLSEPNRLPQETTAAEPVPEETPGQQPAAPTGQQPVESQPPSSFHVAPEQNQVR